MKNEDFKKRQKRGRYVTTPVLRVCVGVTFLGGWGVGGYDPLLQVPLKDGKIPV